MPDLLIKENELRQLDVLIGPIPTQFGLPLVNFFQQVANLRAKEVAETSKEEKSFAKKEKAS